MVRKGGQVLFEIQIIGFANGNLINGCILSTGPELVPLSLLMTRVCGASHVDLFALAHNEAVLAHFLESRPDFH